MIFIAKFPVLFNPTFSVLASRFRNEGVLHVGGHVQLQREGEVGIYFLLEVQHPYLIQYWCNDFNLFHQQKQGQSGR